MQNGEFLPSWCLQTREKDVNQITTDTPTHHERGSER